MTNIAQNPLLVMEYSGTARSGKGTIVADLSERYVGVTSEETGADYRAITKALLMTGYLEPDMPSERVTAEIEKIGAASLSDLAAQRDTIIAESGKESLYCTEVDGLVADVSPVGAVRTAVKSGFRHRVETIRDQGQHRVLLVDGRNLSKVIEQIDNTQLLLRTFVSCFDIEAAWREAERSNVPINSPTFREVHHQIRKRNHADATRPVDAVKPDEELIDYWHNPELIEQTVQAKADLLYKGDFPEAFDHEVMRRPSGTHETIRYGAGRLAVRRGMQIHFDTTDFRVNSKWPVAAMLEAAHVMFVEALQEHNAAQSKPADYRLNP